MPKEQPFERIRKRLQGQEYMVPGYQYGKHVITSVYTPMQYDGRARDGVYARNEAGHAIFVPYREDLVATPIGDALREARNEYLAVEIHRMDGGSEPASRPPLTIMNPNLMLPQLGDDRNQMDPISIDTDGRYVWEVVNIAGRVAHRITFAPAWPSNRPMLAAEIEAFRIWSDRRRAPRAMPLVTDPNDLPAGFVIEGSQLFTIDMARAAYSTWGSPTTIVSTSETTASTPTTPEETTSDFSAFSEEEEDVP